MKKPTILVIALFVAATACNGRDTKPENVWRVVEPRLTGADGWRRCWKAAFKENRAIQEAACEPVQTPPVGCDNLATRADTVRALSYLPSCTGVAISTLETFARTDPAARSDLAGAYYVRAQREDRPLDLLIALKYVDEALKASPRLATGHFNRALVLEALGLIEDAAQAWDRFLALEKDPQWIEEAQQRRRSLLQQGNRSAPADATLIEPFPSTAMKHFDEVLLAECAADPTETNIARVRKFALALSKRLQNDPYPLDAVNVIANTRNREALQKGHQALADAFRAELSFQKSAGQFQLAAELLERAGSPLALRARLGYAAALSNAPDRTEALTAADSAIRAARRHGYRHLLARLHWIRAHILSYQTDYIESIASYDAAFAEFEQLGDLQGLASVLPRRGGVLLATGNHARAWREAVKAIRYSSRIVETKERHNFFGHLAETALALRNPEAALLYQNAVKRFIEDEMSSTQTPGQLDVMANLRTQLAVALRNRARIEIELEDYESAISDLDESDRLYTSKNNLDIARLLETRMQEARGRSLRGRPQQALRAFTKALELSKDDEFRTQRASLFAQRAEAHKRAGNMEGFESDLRDALNELHAEEMRVLEPRRVGAGEEIWSSYFSRFQETYRLLIRLLTEQRRHFEAFTYAERARAFEPLDLVLKLELTPRSFRDLAAKPELKEIQKTLPPGMFIVEYAVLDDHTYTWILSRDQGVVVKQRARREDVERWSTAIERAAQQSAARPFEEALSAPYEGLIAGPLSLIRKMPGGSQPRLVIVPDIGMHGLPFAALRDPITERYLLEDATVSTAGSTLLYVFSRIRDEALSAANERSALLVGDPAFDPELASADKIHPLPHARLEVEALRHLYDPLAHKLVGGDAAVPEFLKGAREHAIVHFAGHGIVNAQTPSQSLILLAPSSGHTGELNAEELLTRLQADRTRLFVLGACSSAGGLPVGPEGVAPLVRPLIGSGVPAVVGSLWSVGDATAKELLVSFHQWYRQGSDAAESLRAAQIGLLRSDNPGLTPARTWGAFQVIGHASSPFTSTHDKEKEKPP